MLDTNQKLRFWKIRAVPLQKLALQSKQLVCQFRPAHEIGMSPGAGRQFRPGESVVCRLATGSPDGDGLLLLGAVVGRGRFARALILVGLGSGGAGGLALGAGFRLLFGAGWLRGLGAVVGAGGFA